MGRNPFDDIDFAIHANTKREEGKFVSEGEILLPKYYDMENANIVKIYSTPSNRKVITLLSANAIKLFLWIAYELEYGKDAVWINKHRYMKEAQISSINTYKKAIGELERYELIRLSKEKSVYWINPRYLFKGSRITKYPNKIKR